MKLILALVTFLIPITANAYPKKCVGDDASGHVSMLSGKNCNVKCLAVASPNAPKDSNAYIYIKNTPLQMNARCISEDGTAGAAGHGTGCYSLKTLKFVTSCNPNKDMYKGY